MTRKVDRSRLARAGRAEHDAFVLAAVRADPMAAAALDRADRLGAPDWALAAGAVYQNAWNALTGASKSSRRAVCTMFSPW